MGLMKFATATAERDVQINEDAQLIWVYPDGAKLLNRAGKLLQDYPGDTDDAEALKKIKEIRDFLLQLHDRLWPS